MMGNLLGALRSLAAAIRTKYPLGWIEIVSDRDGVMSVNVRNGPRVAYRTQIYQADGEDNARNLISTMAKRVVEDRGF